MISLFANEKKKKKCLRSLLRGLSLFMLQITAVVEIVITQIEFTVIEARLMIAAPIIRFAVPFFAVTVE